MRLSVFPESENLRPSSLSTAEERFLALFSSRSAAHRSLQLIRGIPPSFPHSELGIIRCRDEIQIPLAAILASKKDVDAARARDGLARSDRVKGQKSARSVEFSGHCESLGHSLIGC